MIRIFHFFNKPSNFWQGDEYAQFSLFNAKIFQMTPLASTVPQYSWLQLMES